MFEKISVIVPIYCVEAYLGECIESIQNQSYTNIEIILVDDGSPDLCGKICEQYAAKDNRIIVIHKRNGGLSDARNAGLKVATGDYLYFVDSDDRLTPTSIEEMLCFAKENDAQMVIGGFERFEDSSGKVFFSSESNGLSVQIMNQSQLVKDFYRDGCQAWAVLYKRNIHDGIFFPVGEINEDEAVVFRIMERVTTAVVTNRVVYSYRHRAESITTASFSPKKLVWVKHCKDNLEWIRKNYPELESEALSRLLSSILWSMREMALTKESFSKEMKKIRKELKSNFKVFKNIKTTTQQRLRLYMINYFPVSLYKMIECSIYLSRGKK